MEKISTDSTTYKNMTDTKIQIKHHKVIQSNNKFHFYSPPDPLIERKHIPVPSPKFGKNLNYIKLNQFIDEEQKDEFQQMEHNQFLEKFEKDCELSFYLNSSQMLDKLVYNRTNLTKDKNINLDNIVNLKKISIDKDQKFCNSNNYSKKKFLKLNNNNNLNVNNGDKENNLVFESRFESGNLLASYKITESSYQLVLQNDTNTHGYSQWFFIRVSNTKKGSGINFNIINMMKSYSLFNKGMKISIYSEKKAEEEKIGWFKAGDNVSYYRNGLFKFVKNKKRYLSSLSFNYEFEYDDDVVYFANSIPYTFTKLNLELNEYQLKEKKYPFFYRKMLCMTPAGNCLDFLVITDNLENQMDNENENEIKNESENTFCKKNNMTSPKNEKQKFPNDKPGIIIMARAHPGETSGSWMMKGVLDFLLSETNEAKFLRKNFIFKIIPMLNPDGVVCGNYRTSLAGCDLNRRWNKPNEIIHPEIFNAKRMILKMASSRDLALICDLHGHSGAHNIFMYGNKMKDDKIACKIFPFILSKITDVFNFSQCSFGISKRKAGTAKINLFKEINNGNVFKMPNVFTIEASFCGGNRGKFEGKHFTTGALMDMGRDLCLAIISYKDLIKEKRFTLKLDKGSKILEFTMDRIKNELEIEENKKSSDNYLNNNQDLERSDYSNEESGDDEDGSDSEPSVDNFEIEQISKLIPKGIHKKKKTRKLTISKNKFFHIAKFKNKTSLFLEKIQSKEISILKENLEKIIREPKKTENFPLIQNFQINSPKFNIQKEKTQINISKTKKFLNLNIMNTEIDIHKEEVETKKVKIKKNGESQTEEIFFTKPWTFFHALTYKVLGSSNNSYSPKLLNMNNLTRLKFSKSPEFTFKYFNTLKISKELAQGIQAEPKKNINIHTNNIEFFVKTKTNIGNLHLNHYKYSNNSKKL